MFLSVLDYSAVCLLSSDGELNYPEIELGIFLAAPRGEQCFIFRNHKLVIMFWYFSSTLPWRRHNVCLSQLFPLRQFVFQEVLGPLFSGRNDDDVEGDFQRKKTWWNVWKQGLKVQTSSLHVGVSSQLCGKSPPICSQHSIIRRRLWTRHTARFPQGGDLIGRFYGSIVQRTFRARDAFMFGVRRKTWATFFFCVYGYKEI